MGKILCPCHIGFLIIVPVTYIFFYCFRFWVLFSHYVCPTVSRIEKEGSDINEIINVMSEIVYFKYIYIFANNFSNLS